MKEKVSDLPVMNACCKTCPFKEDEDGRMLDPELAGKVVGRNLFKGHQICHSTEGENREPVNRCKGSYDHNFEIYKRMGLDQWIK